MIQEILFPSFCVVLSFVFLIFATFYMLTSKKNYSEMTTLLIVSIFFCIFILAMILFVVSFLATF